jgi:hypothetical protein
MSRTDCDPRVLTFFLTLQEIHNNYLQTSDIKIQRDQIKLKRREYAATSLAPTSGGMVYTGVCNLD